LICRAPCALARKFFFIIFYAYGIQLSTSHVCATKPFALVCYILSDILFWSTLFTSVAAFYYAHTAIIRSEEISYIPYIWSFLKVQVFPILFTVIDTLITVFQVKYDLVPYWFFFTAFVHFSLFLFFQSSILFCRRRDDYIKSSPYDQVRDGKWRLFSFILFQIVVHILTIPYLSISLAQDFLVVLDFPSQYVQALPLHQAADMFVVHITTFVVRPFLILITILSLIAPYRKTFLLLFCPCCPHNS
uniref:G protein-coupled receptor n=1 Tax=Angiostrongylus cantonensis TaxID=6313 RepID=A0A0K0D0A6_ANGCA